VLRMGLAGGVASGDSTFEEAVKRTPEQAAQRFEHYELVTGEDGKPVELGRSRKFVTATRTGASILLFHGLTDLEPQTESKRRSWCTNRAVPGEQ
jgi:hypothetical protein